MDGSSTAPLDALVAAVESALAADDTSEQAMTDSFHSAMTDLLAAEEPIPTWAEEPWEGQAVGNLLHSDRDGRFHILAVVFPAGTSSGVHFHGCWGLIGYLRGGDEETRYRSADGKPVETSRHVWHQGDITSLLPELGEGWHRVRNPGPGAGVSVHVLCRSPDHHPHQFWDREQNRILDFPFVEVAPGRWRAQLD